MTAATLTVCDKDNDYFIKAPIKGTIKVALTGIIAVAAAYFLAKAVS